MSTKTQQTKKSATKTQQISNADDFEKFLDENFESISFTKFDSNAKKIIYIMNRSFENVTEFLELNKDLIKCYDLKSRILDSKPIQNMKSKILPMKDKNKNIIETGDEEEQTEKLDQELKNLIKGKTSNENSYIDQCRKSYKSENGKKDEVCKPVNYFQRIEVKKTDKLLSKIPSKFIFGDDEGVYEVLRDEWHTHLYFDFDFSIHDSDDEVEVSKKDQVFNLINNLYRLRNHIGNCSIIGYTNSRELFELINSMKKNDKYTHIIYNKKATKYFSSHVVFYETTCTRNELNDFVDFCKDHLIKEEFNFDLNPYKRIKVQQSLRHGYSPKVFWMKDDKGNYSKDAEGKFITEIDKTKYVSPSNEIKVEHTFIQLVNPNNEIVCELSCDKLKEIFNSCHLLNMEGRKIVNEYNKTDFSAAQLFEKIVKEINDRNLDTPYSLDQWKELVFAIQAVDIDEETKTKIIEEAELHRISEKGNIKYENDYKTFKRNENTEYDNAIFNEWLTKNNFTHQLETKIERLLITDIRKIIINRVFENFDQIIRFIKKYFRFNSSALAYVMYGLEKNEVEVNDIKTITENLKALKFQWKGVDKKGEECIKIIDATKAINEHRECFKSVSFFTPKDNCITLWEGFPFDPKKDYDNELIEKTIGVIIKHITKSGSKSDSKAANIWLRNYIRNIFRSPSELTGTCVAIKSIQGVGKNILLNILIKAFGEAMCVPSLSAGDAFGEFNDSIEHKKIVVINEVNNMTVDQLNKAKTLVTDTKFMINGKGIKRHVSENFASCFFFTNLDFEVEKNDRRFTYIHCNSEKLDENYVKDILKLVYDPKNTRTEIPQASYFENLLGWLLYSDYEKIDHEQFKGIPPHETCYRCFNTKAKIQLIARKDKHGDGAHYAMQKVIGKLVSEDNVDLYNGKCVLKKSALHQQLKQTEELSKMSQKNLLEYIEEKCIGSSFQIPFGENDEVKTFTVTKYNDRNRKGRGKNDKDSIYAKLGDVAYLELSVK